MSDFIPGMLPAEVASYDPDARSCRVRIPGLTDGSSELPEAVIMPPIGDRSYADDDKDQTELRILAGDPVWVMFEAGDPRFPIIMGARTKRIGNPTNWRRWRHANIEMTADSKMIWRASDLEIHVSGTMKTIVGGDVTETYGGKQQTDVTGEMTSTAAASTHTAASHALNANTTVAGSFANVVGAGGAIGVTMTGGTLSVTNMTVTYTGCSITSDGKKIDHTHTHNENNGAGAPTDPPNS